MWLFVVWVSGHLGVGWMGWGCTLERGEGLNMSLGLRLCGSGWGTRWLLNMSCWIRQMHSVVLQYLLPSPWCCSCGSETLSTMVLGTYDEWSAGDRNSASWLGSSYVTALKLWALSKYYFWLFFFALRWFWTASMLTGVDNLPGWWIVLLWRIPLDKDIFRPMGVDFRSNRRSLMDLPVSWVMLRAVFRVLTCCSMKLWDWGKWGEDRVWSMH